MRTELVFVAPTDDPTHTEKSYWLRWRDSVGTENRVSYEPGTVWTLPPQCTGWALEISSR